MHNVLNGEKRLNEFLSYYCLMPDAYCPFGLPHASCLIGARGIVFLRGARRLLEDIQTAGLAVMAHYARRSTFFIGT